MTALYIIGGIVGYFLLGTIFVGVMVGLKELKKGDDAFPFCLIFWPICLVVSIGILLYGSAYSLAVWIASPRKAKPMASPSTPSVIDLSSVPPLPDPETMPDEFKGRK